MRERPILFKGRMVRAILAGTKTQTRRVVRVDDGKVRLSGPAFLYLDFDGVPGLSWRPYGGAPTQPYPRPEEACPYGVPGDRLWVRETWRADDFAPDDPARTIYAADGPEDVLRETRGIIRWRPSIYMTRDRSRTSLEVTAVRVERLQDISEGDARAEGAVYHDGGGIGHSGWRHDPAHGYVYATARDSFGHGWDSINGKRAAWASNPWVWVIEFKPAGQELGGRG